MAKTYLTLQPSEGVILTAAAQIYSGYVIAGRVPDGEEQKWLEKSLREAIRLARATDDVIVADGEMD